MTFAAMEKGNKNGGCASTECRQMDFAVKEKND